ncbi:MAG: sulfotransferase family protein [Solirubrobacteraceae bacterium]
MREAAQSSPAAGATQTRVPDFFIVGPPKSGTTALYEMLRRHPEIYMPDIKEPRFFATDMRSRFQPARGHTLPATLEEYLPLFTAAAPEQRVGEASSLYLSSNTAARQIADVQPAARIIAILREPASFLRSLHHQLLRSHVETKKDLRKAISLEAARREGRHVPRRSHLPQLLQYSEQVRYVEQLSRYRAAFPPEQLLVLIYDDFRRDNQATLHTVLRFLGVDDAYPIEEVNVKQTTRTMRSQQLDDLLHSVSLGRSPLPRAAKLTVKALTPPQLRRNAFGAIRRRGVYGDVPPPDASLMAELRHRFKPEVVALSDYLDRDLVALWGYDELD